MTFKVAYDDEIDNEQKVINYFNDVSIVFTFFHDSLYSINFETFLFMDIFQQLKIPNPKSYLPSLLKVKKFITKKMLEYINKPAKLRYLEATSEHGEYFTIFNTICEFIANVFN